MGGVAFSPECHRRTNGGYNKTVSLGELGTAKKSAPCPSRPAPFSHRRPLHNLRLRLPYPPSPGTYSIPLAGADNFRLLDVSPDRPDLLGPGSRVSRH